MMLTYCFFSTTKPDWLSFEVLAGREIRTFLSYAHITPRASALHTDGLVKMSVNTNRQLISTEAVTPPETSQAVSALQRYLNVIRQI